MPVGLGVVHSSRVHVLVSSQTLKPLGLRLCHLHPNVHDCSPGASLATPSILRRLILLPFLRSLHHHY